MENKLLPCPFCGGEAMIHISGVSQGYRVACKRTLSCGAKLEWFDKEDDAIDSWNTRKPMERIVEQLEKKINVINNQIDRDSIWGLLGVREGYKDAIETVRSGVEE